MGCVRNEFFTVRCGDSSTGAGQHYEAVPSLEEAAHKTEHPIRGPAAAGETALKGPLDRSGSVRAEFRAGELLDLRRYEGVRCRHALLNAGRQRPEGAFADTAGARFGAGVQTPAGHQVAREEVLCAHRSASHPRLVANVTSKNCAYRDSNSELSLSSQALCRLVHSLPA